MSLLGIGLILAALVLIGVPIAISLGLTAVVAMLTGPGGVASLPNAALVMYSGATSFPLIAIPLFMLAGAIMNASGISRRLIDFASSLVGFIRGGLSMVDDQRLALLRGDQRLGGGRTSPHWDRSSFRRWSEGATPGPLRPAGDVFVRDARSDHTAVDPDDPVRRDVGQLHHRAVSSRGIIPGVLGGLLMMFVAYLLARRYDFPRERMFPAGACVVDIQGTRPGRSRSPIIILGGIFGGWVTATEGAGLAVVASVFHWRSRLPRAQLVQPSPGDSRGRHADRSGHATRRGFGIARRLPHRGARPAASRRRHHGADSGPMGYPAVAERLSFW